MFTSCDFKMFSKCRMYSWNLSLSQVWVLAHYEGPTFIRGQRPLWLGRKVLKVLQPQRVPTSMFQKTPGYLDTGHENTLREWQGFKKVWDLGILLITRGHATLVTIVAPQISWTLGMKYSHRHGFEPKVYKSIFS